MNPVRRLVRLVVLLAAMAYLPCPRAATLLSTDFETSPFTQGWTNSGAGTNWITTEHFSGTRALLVRSNIFNSPALTTTPLQWYRLSFKSKAPGTVNNPGAIGYAYWAAQFFDTNGTLLNDDQYSSVLASANWVTNEFRIRAKHTAGTNTTLVPARMKILFQPIGLQPLYVDDVLVETTTPDEVARWADALYDRIPAKLNYVPKTNRWAHLPLTLQRLRAGQPLRIVMLGDSVQQDTANAPLDCYLQRLYPGSSIELISSTKGGTGMQYFKDHVPEYVTAYLPDLLVLGGISNDDNMTNFQSVVSQVRSNDTARGRTTEILLLTKAWSPNNFPQSIYFFAPSLAELDSVPANNVTVPNDYRGHLLNFAWTNNLEFLDLTGIASQFIYGPAAAAAVGPPVSAGSPYGYWLRDYIHSNDHGKMILGRMLEAFLAPPPRLQVQRNGNTLLLSWPLAATGYQLETRAQFAAASPWTNRPTPFVVTNGMNVLTTNLGAGTNSLFFRLRR